MNPIAGEVWYAMFEPGTPDAQIQLTLSGLGDESEPRTAYVRAGKPGSAVTADGAKVGTVELLAWLAGHACTVTLHPLSDRAAVAERAEFVGVAARVP